MAGQTPRLVPRARQSEPTLQAISQRKEETEVTIAISIEGSQPLCSAVEVIATVAVTLCFQITEWISRLCGTAAAAEEKPQRIAAEEPLRVEVCAWKPVRAVRHSQAENDRAAQGLHHSQVEAQGGAPYGHAQAEARGRAPDRRGG